MNNKKKPMARNIGQNEKATVTRSAASAVLGLALAAMPVAAQAEEAAMPQYDQAIACSGYYTILHSFLARKNPGAAQTLQYKGFASDWLKLAALLRDASDDLEKDFIAKQKDANELILDDSRKSELAQVQNYCMTAGIARFKWDQK